LGYSIVQNFGSGDTMVSQITESETTRGGPNAQDEPIFADGAANMSANAAANTTAPGAFAANSNASRDLVGQSGENGPSENRTDNNFAIDGVTSADSTLSAPVASPPPPPPSAAAGADIKDSAAPRERDMLAKEKAEDKVSGRQVQERAKNDAMLKQAPGSQSGPMRNSENQYDRQLENLDGRTMPKKAIRRDEESGSGRKVVAGRTFDRKDNVWYDTAYQGRPTINVRRGTAEFNRLDNGLRSIANSLSGTIVVVWGAKAYRIQ
jgi:hypothetical protein